MSDKKLRDIPGIGHVTEQTLNGLGIIVGSDIENHMVEVYINFSETFFEFLQKAGQGISRNLHEERKDGVNKKSISYSKSFRSITRYE